MSQWPLANGHRLPLRAIEELLLRADAAREFNRPRDRTVVADPARRLGLGAELIARDLVAQQPIHDR